MFCFKCGNKILDDSVFCPRCGTKLPMYEVEHEKNIPLNECEHEEISDDEPLSEEDFLNSVFHKLEEMGSAKEIYEYLEDKPISLELKDRIGGYIEIERMYGNSKQSVLSIIGDYIGISSNTIEEKNIGFNTCKNCGIQIAGDREYCTVCASKVGSSPLKSDSEDNYSTSNSGHVTEDNTKKTLISSFCYIIGAIIFLIISLKGCNIIGGTSETEIINEACKAVKSQCYKDTSMVADTYGEIIYKTGNEYIVTVRYKYPEREYKNGSCACRVEDYGKSVMWSSMTTPQRYDYDYKGDLEELKALWSMD